MMSKTPRVLLLSRYSRNGASARVRCLQYLPYLQDRGVWVTCSPLLSDSYIRNIYSGRSKFSLQVLIAYTLRISRMLAAAKYEAIWLQYEIYPWFPFWLEALLGTHGIPCVVDYDDATFHRYDAHRYSLVRGVLGKKIDKVMRHSTCVVAGNEYIAKRARSAGAKWVEIIPSVVDVVRYHKPLTDMRKRSDGRFSVGWMGTPLTSRYVKRLLPIFQEGFLEGKTKLVMVGGDPGMAESNDVLVRGWTEESEVDEIAQFDVGIMPLDDTPWERGKCGYKLIQYMACGKPVIASPVGVNKEIVKHGWNGYLAHSDEEWRWAVDSLMANPQLAREMGANGRKLVEEKYSVQSNVSKLAEIFRDVAKK